MSSTLILNVRICQKLLKPFFCQGSSALMTQKTSLCKSSQLPLSTRFLSTRDSNPNPDGRQTDRGNIRQGEVKNTTIRCEEEEPWDEAAKRKDTLRQRFSYPKSVFAAGTAKKTAEMLRRKAALVSQVKEQHVEETEGRTRGAGRT